MIASSGVTGYGTRPAEPTFFRYPCHEALSALQRLLSTVYTELSFDAAQNTPGQF